jgi:hypothetical protein
VQSGLQRGQTALQMKIACNALCNAVFDDFGLCHQIRFDSKAAGLQRPRELDASLENALLTFFYQTFMSHYRTYIRNHNKVRELPATALNIYFRRTTISRHQTNVTQSERGTYHLTALAASTRGYSEPRVYQEHDFAMELPTR